MPLSTDVTVGQLVAKRPSRSRVFQNLGIDFCCGGKNSLADAARAKGLDPDSVLQVLLAGESDTPASADVDAAAMGLSELCDHIEQTHHHCLREELPRLGMMVRKVAAVHGFEHPWTVEIDNIFTGFAPELQAHMQKEEQAVFPLIRKLDSGDARGSDESVGQAIDEMENEHQHAGGDMQRMRDLSDGFTPPRGACNTFRAMLDGLRELETDLHLHVHKENNVLFVRALQAGQPVPATA